MIKTDDFRVYMYINRGEDDSGDHPVYWKHDGQRFAYNKTVKLNTDTKYTVKFVLQPALYPLSLSIGGNELKLEKKKEVAIVNDYIAKFNTIDMPVTEKGSRKELQIIMHIEDKGVFNGCIQTKIYKTTDKRHARWGEELHHIEWECMPNEEKAGFVTVTKESFR
ncbi:CB1 cannabinoid receptor-interacting protein 1-like [Saccoglossus kowalevskii]|uniref:CB1 cannabinoid receptor-interacting protein 1 n=1 Tax=Saccoglossus kowalevskii TaxID=10224 RepID=A0ABM0GK21_SACKO|nr:PREDICTED: CB1 cannabinoid receptor-interacting protein 1-like isoform X1 [Saccoglossus kowalevskii]XP_006812528.1 PREDICTED: CB1 cannabinoid receptor-interacting protein 1-like isoform X2 [Saccoglossus kowalevskii]